MSTWRAAVLLAVVMLGLPVHAEYEVLLLQDDPAAAPGGGTDGTYLGFTGEATVSATSGDLVVGGTADGFAQMPTIRSALWEIPAGATMEAAVARQEDVAPGVSPAADFSSVATPAYPVGPVNGSGTTAFLALLDSNQEGIWSGDAGGLTLVAVEDGAAGPFAAGIVYGDLNEPVINDAGAVAFHCEIDGPGVSNLDDFAILAGMPGSLAIVAREGSAAPGVTGGPLFNAFFDPFLAADGQVCFNASYIGGTGIWAGPPNNPQPLALQGDTAPGPGLTFGTVFGSFDSEINQASWTGGQVAFRNFINDGGTHRSGVWAGPVGSYSLIAATGMNAPGTSLPIGGLIGNPVVAASGHVAFRAKLDTSDPGVTNDTDEILCYGLPGSVEVILRAGDEAPGFPGSVDFESFGVFNEFEMAPDGRLVFNGSQSDNVTPTFWVVSPDGSIDLIANEGISFSDGGETWTIDNSAINIRHSGNVSFNIDITGFNGSDGRPSPFGPDGQLVFSARLEALSDGSQRQALVRYFEPVPVLVPPSLEIAAGLPGPDDVRVLVETVSGQKYRLWKSEDLDQLDPWVLVTPEFAGTGATVPVDDLGVLSGGGGFYYRVETVFP